MTEYERLCVPRSTYYYRRKHGIPCEKGGRSGRFSGLFYENTPDKIGRLKEKYKDGITPAILAELFSGI